MPQPVTASGSRELPHERRRVWEALAELTHLTWPTS